MTQIQAIKAEVERRLKSIHEWKVGWERKLPLNRNKTYYKNAGKEAAYDAILSLIESLEKEPDNFNDALVAYYGRIPEDKDTYDAARHFAMWGIHAVSSIPVQEFKAEQETQGLDEAAEELANEHGFVKHPSCKPAKYSYQAVRDVFIEAAKAGAKWKEAQQ